MSGGCRGETLPLNEVRRNQIMCRADTFCVLTRIGPGHEFCQCNEGIPNSDGSRVKAAGPKSPMIWAPGMEDLRKHLQWQPGPWGGSCEQPQDMIHGCLRCGRRCR